MTGKKSSLSKILASTTRLNLKITMLMTLSHLKVKMTRGKKLVMET